MQAEAERERRARVIAADGEFQASTKLAQAARAMSQTPDALQLRLPVASCGCQLRLQTVVDVAAEKNSTLVMPFPVKLLRFFDHAATAVARSASADEESPVTGALTRAHRPAGLDRSRSVDGPRDAGRRSGAADRSDGIGRAAVSHRRMTSP